MKHTKMKQSLKLAFLKEQLLQKNNIRMLYSYIVTYFIGKMQDKGGILNVSI